MTPTLSLPQVVLDPAVMVGKPVIAGTRITVELLLERLAAGHTREDIERSFPHMPPGSVLAALRYALDSLRNEVVIPVRQSA